MKCTRIIVALLIVVVPLRRLHLFRPDLIPFPLNVATYA